MGGQGGMDGGSSEGRWGLEMKGLAAAVAMAPSIGRDLLLPRVRT